MQNRCSKKNHLIRLIYNESLVKNQQLRENIYVFKIVCIIMTLHDEEWIISNKTTTKNYNYNFLTTSKKYTIMQAEHMYALLACHSATTIKNNFCVTFFITWKTFFQPSKKCSEISHILAAWSVFTSDCPSRYQKTICRMAFPRKQHLAPHIRPPRAPQDVHPAAPFFPFGHATNEFSCQPPLFNCNLKQEIVSIFNASRQPPPNPNHLRNF